MLFRIIEIPNKTDSRPCPIRLSIKSCKPRRLWRRMHGGLIASWYCPGYRKPGNLPFMPVSPPRPRMSLPMPPCENFFIMVWVCSN